MSNLKLLSYWIRGKPLTELGAVKVSLQETVLDVLERIVCDHSLDLSAAQIQAFKIPICIDVYEENSVKDALGSLSITALGGALRLTRKLSSYFNPEPPIDQLHLIIDMLTIHCWVRGQPLAGGFVLNLPNYHTVHDFQALAAKSINTTPNSLVIYKILATDDDRLSEVLGVIGSGKPLSGNHLVRESFDGQPFSHPLWVVVEVPDASKRPPPSPNQCVPKDGDDPLFAARKLWLSDTLKENPSSSGTPSSFRTRQRQNCIPCGRPRDLEETIPTTLLHHAFGQFIDDCKSIEIKPEDEKLAQDLEVVMAGLYTDEAKRAENVSGVFKRHGIHFSVSQVHGTNFWVDGDMSVLGHRYVIIEFKNEAGSTSSEPYFEAIAYYLESTRELALEYKSPLPCLLLCIFGPYIVFAGAAWNQRPMAQTLSTPIAFHFHSTDTLNQLTVTRHMAAFRVAFNTLEEYYRQLKKMPLPKTASPCKQIFPYPTSYDSLANKDGSTSAVDFQYDSPVAPEKLIFFATEGTSRRKICVKFVQSYSLEAHQCLVTLGHAPALRGFQKVAGGWIMVVFDALLDFETLYAHPKGSLPSSVFKDMSEKLAIFHEEGFVHGDIRDVNVMVSKTEPTKFAFVDFDWSGEKGKARYPSRVNNETVDRPPGAFHGNIITADHDRFMLDRIVHRYKRSE